MKDFVLVGGKANLSNFAYLLGCYDAYYIVVETDFTINHFEKLLASCSDRGSFKWIAETKVCAYEAASTCESARLAHIDECDYFPRAYFFADSLLKEFEMWRRKRKQDFQKITVPIEFSPQFDNGYHNLKVNKFMEGKG
jgi:hypothetical protein